MTLNGMFPMLSSGRDGISRRQKNNKTHPAANPMTSLSRFFFSSVAAIALSSSASAISIRHDVSDAAYLDFASEYPLSSIGEVDFGGLSGGSGTYLGFGNDSHWVLTAGHVTAELAVTSVIFGGEVIAALGQITHPGFGGGYANDLGLVQIASAPTGIAPVRFTAQSNLIGERVIFGGYGLHGTGTSGGPGAISYDGANRGAENIVDATQIYGRGGLWVTNFTNPTEGPALPLEGTTAPGDSGGGMFWHDGTDWRLAGVTSIGTELRSRYGDQSGFVALYKNISWLEQYTGIMAIAAVPDAASSAALLVMGLALLAGFRRRLTGVKIRD